MDLKTKLLETSAVIDNEFLDKYITLVEINKNTYAETFITQRHHIIPKHVFNYTETEVDNSDENLVNLKYADHLLAHYYLMQCASATKYELANANAIFKTINNPHSIDTEKWIISNRDLLQTINKRRCELISLHHADVSGSKNPRATKIYQYNIDGKLEFVYPIIKDCAAVINYNPDSLRSMLSKNKLLLVDNTFYSKSDSITKTDIDEYLKYRAELASHNRTEYKFVCECCGKEYSLKLNEADYKNRKDTHHYCYDCTKSGVIFRGVAKSEIQKEKMRQAYWKRK